MTKDELKATIDHIKTTIMDLEVTLHWLEDGLKRMKEKPFPQHPIDRTSYMRGYMARRKARRSEGITGKEPG